MPETGKIGGMPFCTDPVFIWDMNGVYTAELESRLPGILVASMTPNTRYGAKELEDILLGNGVVARYKSAELFILWAVSLLPSSQLEGGRIFVPAKGGSGVRRTRSASNE